MTTATTGLNEIEMRRVIERELESGERVRWLGQPVPDKLASTGRKFMLFAIPLTAFAVFWTALVTWIAGLFGLFGLPFIGIGVFMFTYPQRLRQAARKTVYALTDKRAIVAAPTSLVRVSDALHFESYMPMELRSLTRTEAADGSGDLVFAIITRRTNNGATTTRKGFMGVADVQQVERTLRRELLDVALPPSTVSAAGM